MFFYLAAPAVPFFILYIYYTLIRVQSQRFIQKNFKNIQRKPEALMSSGSWFGMLKRV